MGCGPSRHAESTPLKVDKVEISAAADDGKGGATDFSTSKVAAPAAFLLYIAVVVVKTLTTKALLVGVKGPVALSAWSSFVTCLMCVPAFAYDPKLWGVPTRKNYKGLALVSILLSLDMGFTNIAVSMLSVPIQQCILAVNPTFTVFIESFVRRRVSHPAIYVVVMLICVGPVVTNFSGGGKSSEVGILMQLLGVLASACKCVFAHSVMRDCKRDLGSAWSFLFWLDILSLIILVPWAFITGEMYALMAAQTSFEEWAKLIGNSALGGARFFSQVLVLRYSTATNLACANTFNQASIIYISIAIWNDPQLTWLLVTGTLLTIVMSALYTFLKVSSVLQRPACAKVKDDFEGCVTGPCKKKATLTSQETTSPAMLAAAADTHTYV